MIWYYVHMADMPLSRTAMSTAERRFRSALHRLIDRAPFLRGSLVERQTVCGKPNCRCARGHKHRALYLMASKDGRVRQVYVPGDWEPIVRQWIDHHRQLRDLLEQVSDLHWDKVRQRQGPSPSCAESSDTRKRSSGSKA